MGSQGRNLFLRSIANRTIGVQSNGASAATQIREFDIVTRNADGTIATIQRPFAEINYKTSGGHDNYNGLQTQLVRRFNSGITMNIQYTYGRSFGNTAGSNEALTAANNARDIADFDYDEGYNTFDVRHTFNLSALFSLPFGRGHKYGSEWKGVTQALLGGWEVGGIVNARSGLPIQVTYSTSNGNASAGSDYTAVSNAVLNIPAGASSGTLAVQVLGDTADEQNEAFLVTLSSPVGATLGDAVGQGSILDDDGRPALCKPIVTAPFTISTSDSYCLVGNLSFNADGSLRGWVIGGFYQGDCGIGCVYPNGPNDFWVGTYNGDFSSLIHLGNVPGYIYASTSWSVRQVPEPGVAALMLTGLLGAWVARRRRTPRT